MNTILNKIDGRLKRIEKGLALVAGLIALLVMFSVTLDVFLRNVFNAPIVAVYELVPYLFVGLVALGFPYVQSQKKNIIIELLTGSLPGVYKNVLDFIGTILGLFIIGVIAWQTGLGTLSAIEQNEYSSGLLQLPIWPTKLVLTVGVFFLGIRLFLDALMTLFQLKGREEEAETNTFVENKPLRERERYS